MVKLLFKQLNIDKEDCLHRKTSIERISQDTVNVIKTFYQRDDISRMAPGKRDVITIQSDTGKEKVQRRHLYISIKEVYSIENLPKEEKAKMKEDIRKNETMRKRA